MAMRRQRKNRAGRCGLALAVAAAVYFNSPAEAANPSGRWLQYPRPIPQERDQASMVFDAERDEIVLFGGNNSQPPQKRKDTWVWNGAKWIERHPAASPSKRFLAAMAYDATRKVVVLFGGFNPTGPNGGALGDTWIWNGTNWIQQEPAASPPRRYGAGFAYDA
ncbi:MAG: hypothetical protein ABR589_05650, partial [Chthoniobacterales bacterium]